MRNALLASVFAALCCSSVQGPALAHHGGSAYDTAHPLTVTGTVKEFQFIQPHPLITLDVKDDQGASHRMVGGNDGPESSGPLRLEWKQAKAGRPDHSCRPPFQERLESLESPENFLGQRRSHSSRPASGTRPVIDPGALCKSRRRQFSRYSGSAMPAARRMLDSVRTTGGFPDMKKYWVGQTFRFLPRML